jgi:hypothetical protein
MSTEMLLFFAAELAEKRVLSPFCNINMAAFVIDRASPLRPQKI